MFKLDHYPLPIHDLRRLAPAKVVATIEFPERQMLKVIVRLSLHAIGTIASLSPHSVGAAGRSEAAARCARGFQSGDGAIDSEQEKL